MKDDSDTVTCSSCKAVLKPSAVLFENDMLKGEKISASVALSHYFCSCGRCYYLEAGKKRPVQYTPTVMIEDPPTAKELERQERQRERTAARLAKKRAEREALVREVTAPLPPEKPIAKAAPVVFSREPPAAPKKKYKSYYVKKADRVQK
jgi:hypothetical protein